MFADNLRKIYTVEGGNVIVESIVDKEVSTIYFDTTEGTAKLDGLFAENSLYTEPVISGQIHYGLVGMYDFGFSRYIFAITKRENVCVDSDLNVAIWKILKVSAIMVYQQPLSLSLDEQEYQAVSLRDIISQFTTKDTYYSQDIDLTADVQFIASQLAGNCDLTLYDNLDDRYIWNSFVLSNIMVDQDPNKDYSPFVIPIISGFVGTLKVKLDGPEVTVLMMSRTSRYRAGKRYWCRGVDVDGNVALEVETNLIAAKVGKTAAYRILRGSVPLFWSQTNLNLFKRPEIELQETESEASTMGFERHFKRLLETYGSVDIIDMIDRKCHGADSRQLSIAYQTAVKTVDHPSLKYFKFAPVTNHATELEFTSHINRILDTQGFFICSRSLSGNSAFFNKLQNGILRVNSVDCIDETSISQYLIAKEVLRLMLIELEAWGYRRKRLDSATEYQFQRMWLAMANSLSNYYVGSPMNHPYRICRTWRYQFATIGIDFWTQIVRMYLSHFQHYGTQDSVDLFMGKRWSGYETVADQVLLRRRIIYSDFSKPLFLALFLLVKRFAAPRKIDNLIQFVGAIIWMYIYWFMSTFFGVSKSLFLRTPKYMIDTSRLPDLSQPPAKGLVAEFERLEAIKGIRRIDKRFSSDLGFAPMVKEDSNNPLGR
ncbi:Phosphatidylinositide phosphatase SAC1 [Terramyces sp. JEL0728]|nr:Phosphatidylinositide phosphatase SAC1 [Terramyces sp. JEL0728]